MRNPFSFYDIILLYCVNLLNLSPYTHRITHIKRYRRPFQALAQTMKKPIYLIVTPYFPSPSSWRGAYCYDFARALQTFGHYDVCVLRPGNEADYIYGGIPVYYFKQKRLPSAAFPFLFTRTNRVRLLQKLTAIGIAPKDVAICHAHTALLSDYALTLKAANPNCLALLHHHDLSSFGLDIGRLRFFWIYRLLIATSLRMRHAAMDCHVFVSEGSRQNFLAFPRAINALSADYRHQLRGLSFLKPLSVKGSYILHNGVRLDCFTRMRREHQGFVMGCVANFIPIKGHRYLLQALAQCNHALGDWHLRLIGSGPTLHACQRLTKRLGIAAHVTFETERPHAALPEFYQALDLFILPSYFEGFGCTCVEAFACGTPFITCKHQGLDALIPSAEHPHWLCDPKNADDLAAKILHFHTHRPQQHLTDTVDIQVLVSHFIKYITR